MSYKTNSPVKQVWLPLDYEWLNEVIGGTNSFGNFSKAYKERYGIDLHDCFEMFIDADDNYHCVSKIDLLGAYNASDLGKESIRLNYFPPTKCGVVNGVIDVFKVLQGEIAKDLMIFGLQLFQNQGFGFNIVLPVEETPVNSIDDLEVTFYEL